jgi:signal peptidase II
MTLRPSSSLRFFSSRLFLAALGLFWFVTDQASKIASTSLPREGVDLIPRYLRFVYAENPGVAFSGFVNLPDSYRAIVLSLVAIVMIVAVCVFLWKTPVSAVVTRAGYVSVLGGAFGNLADRIRLGYVIDFILVHIDTRWSWPVFNVADIAIAVGVGLLLIASGETKPKEAVAQ